MLKAVIMAGGRGTRISGVRSDIPKPMIPVCGKPVLQWQVECLASQGIRDVTLVVGHLSDKVEEYFGDGDSLGVDISYYREESPLGTAGALVELGGRLDGDFVLLNGDLMLDVDFLRVVERHRASGAWATVAVHPNSHPFDSAVLEIDGDGWVRRWYRKDEERPPCRNRVNAGVHVLSPRAIRGFDSGRLNLDRDVLAPLVPKSRLMSYHTTEYIRDMGTPERYAKVCAEVADDVPSMCRRGSLRRAVFFDRDGTLNPEAGFVTRADQIELAPGAADAVRAANDAGYLAILATNQPVIARGDCTWEELARINATLEEALGREGAYLDDVFVCPHHPDRGFAGERIEYKVECACRKPAPGLLLQAAEEYGIDLPGSWMVGDSWRDEAAGKAAGCSTFVVGRDGSLEEFIDRLG